MTTKTVKTKRGIVEFSVQGSGIPLLFLHGGHSSSNETLFHKGFDLEKCCLITPSRPGYGQTPLLENQTPAGTAALMDALLEELEIDSAIVIGISAGGPSALAFAADFPKRVKKLILISAVTKKWMSPDDKNYQRGKKLFAPNIEKYSWGLFRFFYSCFPKIMAKTMFRELSTLPTADLSKEDVAELFEMIKRQRSKKGFIYDLDQDTDSLSWMNIGCPTLILHSSNDNTVDVAHAKYAQGQIKNAVLKIYPNKWGHLLWLGAESREPIRDTQNFIYNS